MSLTSPTFQAVTILATVVVTAATLLLWNRIRGPRAVRVLSRLTLLSSSYLLAAVAALVSINIAYGGLISGWPELFDNLGATPSTAHGHHGHFRPGFGGPGPMSPGPGGGGPPGQGGGPPGQFASPPPASAP